MALNFQIGEISRFFNIPASTLRYWEDKGVLHPEKGIENRYREYTIEDLMTISDVVFYKNLGLQLKEIREMDGSSPEQHGKLFAEKLSELEQLRQEYPALQDPAGSNPEAIVEGVAEMKRLLKYNDNTIADKLGFGRTTLWRMQKKSGAAKAKKEE